MNNYTFEICTGATCDKVHLMDLIAYNNYEIMDYYSKHKILPSLQGGSLLQCKKSDCCPVSCKVSILFSLQGKSLLHCKKSDCCPISGKVSALFLLYGGSLLQCKKGSWLPCVW